MRSFFKKSIVPLLAIGVLLYFGQYIYMVGGEIDWFRFIMVIGIPVGIPYMFFVIPMHGSLSELLGTIVLCVAIGGFFGFIIAIFLTIRAFIYMIVFPISRLKQRML